MLKRLLGMAGILGLCLLVSGPAPAQSPLRLNLQFGGSGLCCQLQYAGVGEVRAFYRIPTGQKLLERQPQIMRQVGTGLGAKVGEDLSSA
jgi:hypothetical protein